MLKRVPADIPLRKTSSAFFACSIEGPPMEPEQSSTKMTSSGPLPPVAPSRRGEKSSCTYPCSSSVKEYPAFSNPFARVMVRTKSWSIATVSLENSTEMAWSP